MKYLVKDLFEISAKNLITIVLDTELGNLRNVSLLTNQLSTFSIPINSIEEVKIKEKYFPAITIKYIDYKHLEHLKGLITEKQVHLE